MQSRPNGDSASLARALHICVAICAATLGWTVAFSQQVFADDFDDGFDQRSAPASQFHGFTQPWKLIEVAVSEPGRVAEVLVREGDDVEKNDLLARLDDDVLQASLQVAIRRTVANGERDSARNRLNHASKRRNDIAALLDQSHASQTELESADLALRDAESTLLAVQERVDVAEAEVARIKAELKRREVRTPIDGVVVEVNRDAGEYAGVADPVIVKVAELKLLRLRMNVPTAVAHFLTHGSSVQIEFPEIGQSAVGNLAFISPLTDSESGTVRVDIGLDNARGTLRSGVLGIWKHEGAKLEHVTTPRRVGFFDTQKTNQFNRGF